MSDKASDLNAAKTKLSELIDKLVHAESAYDKAVEHSANYLGHDEHIEEVRDEKARSALEYVMSIKKEIEHQTQVVKNLESNY
ncbi:hypothetical protein V3H38_22605 [Vibrio parahaemolyticus]|uniref:hypothetical protein n=1 Tax=Vibrio parahaemolyticus TaxID=670 RepID=UPI0023603202|nr:hypothetical protein [Vibrio parahaemolyticus]